jgi:hypothetical protein
MLAVSGLVLAVSWKNPAHRAVIGMAWGLILLWFCSSPVTEENCLNLMFLKYIKDLQC